MIVSELRTALNTMPENAEIVYMIDGYAIGQIDFVWIAKGGHVVIADHTVCKTDIDRPDCAPSLMLDQYWTAKNLA